MPVPSIPDLTALVGGQNIRISYHGSERDFVVVGSLNDVPTRLEMSYPDGDMELTYTALIDVEVTTDPPSDPVPL
jgi:hypothetical protein